MLSSEVIGLGLPKVKGYWAPWALGRSPAKGFINIR